MSISYGIPNQVNTDNYIRVSIIQTDISTMTAKGQTRGGGGPVYSIDLSKYLGEFAHHPAVGEEWIITKVVNQWLLFRRTDFQNPATPSMLTTNPGDTVFSNQGTLYFADTNVVVNEGTLMVNGSTVHPSGMMILWAGSRSSIAPGWLVCDGASYSQSQFPNLFATIGLTYNPGAGPGLFNVPNTVGRVIVGVDPTDGSFLNQGYAGGAKTVSGASHFHTLSDNGQAQIVQGAAGVIASRRIPTATYTENLHYSASGTTGAGVSQTNGVALAGTTDGATPGATSVLQPYVSMTYLIKT